jgi:hypothetical protein
MWSRIAGDCPSAIVGLLGPDGDYVGTGFFISRRLIMTCEHVVVGTSSVGARRLVGGDILVCRLLDTDPDRDLAVLTLEQGKEEDEPIRPLLGLFPDLLRQFDGRLTAIGLEANTGKPLRLDNLALRLVVGSLGVENDIVREAQITGGAPRGLSGAPVFAMTPGAARPCVGMMVLGGSDSGQSLLRGPDAMVPLWQKAGVEGEIESRLATEVLAIPPRATFRGKHGHTSTGALPVSRSDHDLEARYDDESVTGALARVTRFDEQTTTQEFAEPPSAALGARRRQGWKTILRCLLLAFGVAGFTFTMLRRSTPAVAPPATWIANELFPSVRELVGFAEDLEQFSRIYLLPPKNHLGYRQQVIDLNKQIQLYNCTSDYLSAGHNFFRDRLAMVQPEKLKDLVVRVSEARFPLKFTPAVYQAPVMGPTPVGEPSATETLDKEFQELVTTWSQQSTQLDGTIREAREYLADLEKEMLHAAGLPVPRCPP